MKIEMLYDGTLYYLIYINNPSLFTQEKLLAKAYALMHYEIVIQFSAKMKIKAMSANGIRFPDEINILNKPFSLILQN
jgi:hypothetical protein